VPVADTIPYPWPYDAESGLAPSRMALVLVGVQAQWRALDTDRAVERMRAVAYTLRLRGVLVVHVRHAAVTPPRRPGDDLPMAGDASAALLLLPGHCDLVVAAATHDGFLDTTLDAQLRAHGRDHLLLAGLAAETVVDSTLRSANDRGYECLTLHDLAVPFDPATGARALASITMSGGIFGAIGSSDAVLAAVGDPIPEETPS
jgi:nicotinamidase-related amidase